MGTRADFYIGIGPDAEWMGSLAFDGYRIDDAKKTDDVNDPDGTACWAIKSAATADDFRSAVAKLLSFNSDATSPEQGWPWPWADSHTTDYAYAFVDGACKAFPWGKGADWPDMRERQNVTLGHRSGMIVVGGG